VFGGAGTLSLPRNRYSTDNICSSFVLANLISWQSGRNSGTGSYQEPCENWESVAATNLAFELSPVLCQLADIIGVQCAFASHWNVTWPTWGVWTWKTQCSKAPIPDPRSPIPDLNLESSVPLSIPRNEEVLLGAMSRSVGRLFSQQI